MEYTQDLTIPEFAQRTRQSRQKVYRLCREGHIPSYRVGNSVRIRWEDAEAIRTPAAGRLSPLVMEQVRHAVDNWPPLTTEQREAIVTIFSGGGAE